MLQWIPRHGLLVFQDEPLQLLPTDTRILRECFRGGRCKYGIININAFLYHDSRHTILTKICANPIQNISKPISANRTSESVQASELKMLWVSPQYQKHRTMPSWFRGLLDTIRSVILSKIDQFDIFLEPCVLISEVKGASGWHAWQNFNYYASFCDDSLLFSKCKSGASQHLNISLSLSLSLATSDLSSCCNSLTHPKLFVTHCIDESQHIKCSGAPKLRPKLPASRSRAIASIRCSCGLSCNPWAKKVAGNGEGWFGSGQGGYIGISLMYGKSMPCLCGIWL